MENLAIRADRVDLKDVLRQINTEGHDILLHGSTPRRGSTTTSSHTTSVQGPSTTSRQCAQKLDGWWSEHGISAPLSGTKHLYHPTLGVVCYEYASFQANDDPALKLALYTQP